MATAIRSRTMLTLAEVCEELAVSRSTFYDWRAKRRAPRCIKLPNDDLRIRRSDLDHWLDDREDAARWRRRTKRWREPFDTVALAQGFRSELIRATARARRSSSTPGAVFAGSGSGCSRVWEALRPPVG
ncbi:helix-turn-helix transcriptional regulator [Streptomyces purpurascens]|uniref:helix-turn-helix transcriptional regulator n=1 Tax=Streptomyces purpurascens TaxID=1924 RepID=UPI003C2D5412